MKRTSLLFLVLVFLSFTAVAQKKDKKDDASNDTIKSSDVSGLKFRSIGPALTSGRIADFAVNPGNPNEYYVAVASGHIWKTVNNGNTFEPVFDNYGAYSIGCLAMDPTNPFVVWTGTGENNHQRALGYGNGVYKSTDGGKSWKNMGLKNSRQVGGIVINPEDPDIVYVAAEGSVWGPGGDRGLYKTTDGGTTWEKVLDISENTGVNNVLMDSRDPEVLYATSEQRRRHVHTKIGGGPESAIHKSTDGGKTWVKLSSGLPKGDMGGIGLAISPVNPDVIYAIIEAEGGNGGFYQSIDRGASWSKMSDHYAQGQYYNEIYCDPKDVDKVYSMETIAQVTVDGGKTWRSVGNKARHVDDHAIWIDPRDTRHFLIGGDGGVYETYDAGKNYYFKTNLPVTQFYRVNVDNTEPFYWVFGGTQDNNSLGGPSRNTCESGVATSEWIVTLGGDGFWQAIEPGNPDIVYSAYQYGNIYRYDKKSGEGTKIRPEPLKGEQTYKWNWNAPFILSPHSGTRLYMAANKVFRSDDRGQSWKVISGDITAQVDRNTWPVMGQYWSIDAVAKDVSTSLFGCAVSLAESTVQEDLVYVGTDDGVIQVTEDAGKTWRKTDKFPGVPEYTYVSDIWPDRFDANVVYASFDNILRDDFAPYLLKSADKGRSWTSIANDLPKDQAIHTLAQDHKKPELLFVGTEFGVYFSNDGGKAWTQLKSGLPAVKVPDMVIQERESDLVLATFGRGFYILDDYSPLREFGKDVKEKEAHIFTVKDALMYIQTDGRYGQGSNFYYAPNPPFGATFTYYLKEVPKTLKAARQEKEKELIKEKKPVPMPTMDELRSEEDELAPYLIFTIRDEEGGVVKKIAAKASKGIGRTTWDLRYEGTYPLRLRDKKFDPFAGSRGGILAMPGKYSVSMSLITREGEKTLAGPEPFTARVLNNTTLPAPDRKEIVVFHKKIAELLKAVSGAESFADQLNEQLQYIRQAIQNTPGGSYALMQKADGVGKKLDDIIFAFRGQDPKASEEENFPALPSIDHRISEIVYSQWGSTSAITQTVKDQYALVAEEFPGLLDQLKQISEVDMKELQAELDKLGAPWTPGRVPVWNR